MAILRQKFSVSFSGSAALLAIIRANTYIIASIHTATTQAA